MGLETLKIKFGIHKGKELKDIPDDYLRFLFEKGISKGKIKLYTQRKLNMPKSKFKVTVEDSIGTDSVYEVMAYNSDEAIFICQKQYKIQNTQSFHGTSYSSEFIE